jgi:hypothetical protein
MHHVTEPQQGDELVLWQLPMQALTVLHGSVGDKTEPTRCLCSSDADGLRASEIEHPVQGLNCNGDLSSTTSVGPRTQRIPDHSFQSADGSLHQSPTRCTRTSSASPCVHAARCFGDAGRAQSGRSPRPRSVRPLIVAERSHPHQDGAEQPCCRCQTDRKLRHPRRRQVEL